MPDNLPYVQTDVPVDILVVGGGFAGMWAALTAAREVIEAGANMSVALVSREPFLTIRPRLYEANPQGLQAPLGPTLDAMGVTFIQGNVLHIDPAAQTIIVDGDGTSRQILPYRRLVLATGSTARIPPIKGCGTYSFSIDDHASAIALDAHLARICAGQETTASSTFAIVGAGFTGIEMACEMRDRIAVHSDEQRAQNARIVLLERSDVVGPDLGQGPRGEIMGALEQARIETITGACIDEINAGHIIFAGGSAIETSTCIVTTGQTATIPPGMDNLPRDALGRLLTSDDLRIPGAETIFVAGDAAQARVDDEGNLSMMSCQHAMPMGKHAGYNAAHDLLGSALRPYRQPAYVTCLDLGRAGAVFTTGWERTVQKTGAEAGALKRIVNTQWIYPPAGSREDIFEASHIDQRAGR